MQISDLQPEQVTTMFDTPNPGTLPAGMLIDRLCDEFEQGWLNNQPVLLEQVVRSVSESLRRDLFQALLEVECHYRPITIEAARERFSQLGPWAENVIAQVLASTGTWAPTTKSAHPDTLSHVLGPRPADLPVTVGKYRVVRELGDGGMGIVYLADDPDGRRQVAVKVMKPDRAAIPSARQRFLREARSAMAIEHDHVVPIYQVEENGDCPFLVMPVLRGESLEVRLARESLLPIELVLKVGQEIALGLAAAHEKGLVHRDAKPANTWLEGDPASPDPSTQVRRVKVLDFGLARVADSTDGLSSTGTVVGTPAYMAPEQADGRAVDARADLFSLGAILYRMATGRRAFDGPTTTAVLTAIATHNPPPPNQVNPAIPPSLSTLVMRLLEKDPRKRPESAQVVAAELARIANDQTAVPLRAPRWRVIVPVVVLCLLVGFGTWYLIRKPNTVDTTNPTPRGSVPVTYRGKIDVEIPRPVAGRTQYLRLNTFGALPLKLDDQFKVVVKVAPAAFLYVFWVEPDGTVAPVYPWDSEKEWGSRPSEEKPASELQLPSATQNWTITNDLSGVATLIVLARPTRLDVSDDVVRGWFTGLPPIPLPEGEGTAAIWFNNYVRVTDDPDRGPFLKRVESADMFQRWQSAFQEKVSAVASFESSVSFARMGRKK